MPAATARDLVDPFSDHSEEHPGDDQQHRGDHERLGTPEVSGDEHGAAADDERNLRDGDPAAPQGPGNLVDSRHQEDDDEPDEQPLLGEERAWRRQRRAGRRYRSLRAGYGRRARSAQRVAPSVVTVDIVCR